MAKYIIDIPDEVPVSDKLVPFDMCRPSWYWEAYKKGKAVAEDEVWSLAREIAYCMSLQECIDTGMLHDDDIYDSASGVLEKLTYQEAKEKYEGWRKQKDKIRVGDEVVYADDPNKEKAIVLRLYQPKQYRTLADILCEDGTVVKMIKVENLAWTGRHFDEVEDLLKKMKEQ